MGIAIKSITGRDEQPLTRADVEDLLEKAGASENLDLSNRNLRGIDLAHLHLSGANMSKSNLKQAKLRGAHLSRVNLRESNLSEANLSEVDLSGADLSQSNLSDALLPKADLSGANLSDANLSGADLREATLSATILSQANIHRAMMTGRMYTDAAKNWLHGQGVIFEEEIPHSSEGPPHLSRAEDAQTCVLRIQIAENPLRASTLTAIVSAFTELHTKCWLIQQGRFADLMDYTQTHQPRFAQEANLRIIQLSYNSPALILFDGVGQVLGTALSKTLDAIVKAPERTIDAVAQAPERKEAKKLENEAAAPALEQQEREARLREREREIEIRERQAEAQLRIAEARLKTIDLTVEHALHLVEMLQPQADPQTKAMAARALVPQLLAFGQVQGLEITLLSEPAPPASPA